MANKEALERQIEQVERRKAAFKERYAEQTARMDDRLKNLKAELKKVK